MTTYTIATTREGLDAPGALAGPDLVALAECITDRPHPQWEGMCTYGTSELDPRGFVGPLPGKTGRGLITAHRPGENINTPRTQRMIVWVSAR